MTLEVQRNVTSILSILNQGASTNMVKTAALWVSTNPIVPLGYFGIESDTLRFKLGDGVTAWNSLSYVTGEWDASSLGTDISDLPSWSRLDTSVTTTYVDDANFVLVEQDGVGRKVPVEEFVSTEYGGTVYTAPVSPATASITWERNMQTIFSLGGGNVTVTMPNFAEEPGSNRPLAIYRLGTGTVTLAAASGATINRISGLPLTALRYGKVEVRPYFWLNVPVTLYVASGDLG